MHTLEHTCAQSSKQKTAARVSTHRRCASLSPASKHKIWFAYLEVGHLLPDLDHDARALVAGDHGELALDVPVAVCVQRRKGTEKQMVLAINR